MAKHKRIRRQEAQLAFDALSIEGGLLSPDWLARAAQLAAGAQSEVDYRVPKGLNIRDEIGRYWRIAQAQWSDLHAGLASHVDARFLADRFVVSFLRDAFGFASLGPAPTITQGERSFPIGFATLDGSVPVIIAPAGSGLDTLATSFGEGGKRRSAFGLCQEYLNAEEAALWGIASDGLTLRILRDNASLTRPAWIEADLQRIFTEERYADFAALWLLAHETRFGRPGVVPAECPLEVWRDAGRAEGTRAREFLRGGVEQALQVLGQGFLSHPDNVALQKALSDGSLSKDAYFQQLLRLVYRLIFLLTVEERDLLHPPPRPKRLDESKEAYDELLQDHAAARKLYADGYACRRLRERAIKRSAHDRYADLWEGTKIVFRSLAEGEPRLGLPALAGLFAKSQCAALDNCKLENRALLTAVFRLSWLRSDGGLARVNWRDMGPEELGSVYESLLELVPQFSQSGRTFAFATGGEQKGNARKTSGSYYTPDSLVQVLLASALDPVIESTIAAHPQDPAGALLQLSIVDPACGSGHFLLAAARRLAGHVARLQVGGTPSASQYRHALRQVVGHCIYGVDLNPMAVELCKVSLWMEAVEPGLPLTFLNAHIQHGNALLGATPELMAKGVPDAAWEAIEGDDKKTASALKKRNKTAETQASLLDLWANPVKDETATVTRAFAELETALDVDLPTLVKKEHQFEQILSSTAHQHQRFVADAWCAAFVWPKQPSDLSNVAPTNALWQQVRDNKGAAPPLMVEAVTGLARQYRFFHWHLAFPQVFSRGGFDVALGNPPWDTLSPDAKEFFSVFDDRIRFQSKGEQDATIKHLAEDPAIAAAWAGNRRMIFATAAFLKDSGRFTLFAPGNLGKGDFNLYRLFVELALRLVRPRGWAAQVVPDGLYAGANSMAIRTELFERFRLDVLLGFENAKEAWFPGVDSRAKFTLYSAQKGEATESFRAAFLIRSQEDLRAAGGASALRLPVEMVREFSPDALAVMEFRGQRDIDIARKMYARFPPLGKVVPGTAHRSYLRELESGHVQGRMTEDRQGLPHYEGRMIGQYDHRVKGYRSGRARAAVWEDLPFGSPEKSVQPQWYVDISDVPPQARARIGQYRVGFCDVASPTNERSLVAAMLPRNCIAGAKVPTVTMESATPLEDLLVWLAAANTFTMDFLVRMKVSLTMALTILDSLPFPRLPANDPSARRLVSAALKLVCTGPEMNELWDEMSLAGVVTPRSGDGPPGTCDGAERLRLLAEIEAEVAILYGLSAGELGYILDTFPIVRKSDEKAYDEYRTKRVVLEVYDAMAEAARTGGAYVTRLAPVAADPAAAHADTRASARAQNVPHSVPAYLEATPHAHVSVADLLRAASDDDWATPPSVTLATAAFFALLETLQAMPGKHPASRIRLAARLARSPRLALGLLEPVDHAEWQRVVGQEARQLPQDVTSLDSLRDDAPDRAWQDAVAKLRGTGALVVDPGADVWSAGPNIVPSAQAWMAGRARVAVDIIAGLELETAKAKIYSFVRSQGDGTAAATVRRA